MPTVVAYISGHGFGHASRVIEVLNVLRTMRPDLAFHVRTTVPRWFLDFNVAGTFTYGRARLDVGAVQADSLSVDLEGTLRAYDAIATDQQALVAREIAALAPQRPVLVFADIPALALDVAASLGVPGIAMTNFSWDWIYADYVRDFPAFGHLVDGLRRSYARAALLLRLPLHGDLDAFRHVRDIPFVARRARRARRDVRQRLGLPSDAPVVVLSFGGLGIAVRTTPVVPRDMIFVTNQPLFPGVASPWCRTIPTAELTAAGLRYEDLVATADCVMTKPGYGIVAECIANATPMVYTPRSRFAEYDRLVPGIQAHLANAEISNEDLYGGRWVPALECVLAQPRRAATADVGGARVAAEALLAHLDG
jgi:hypothetical protein